MIVIKQLIAAAVIVLKAFAILFFIFTAMALFLILFIVMREAAWEIHENRKRKMEEKRKNEDDSI